MGRLYLPTIGSGTPAQDALPLVTAADVFVYLGSLESIFTTVAGVLSPQGLFAFPPDENYLPHFSWFAALVAQRYPEAVAIESSFRLQKSIPSVPCHRKYDAITQR